VKINNKWGVIDSLSNIVVRPEYDKIERFYNDSTLYKVKKEGKWGIINVEGKELIKPMYDDVGSYCSHRTIKVESNGKKGAVNLEKGIIIPILYSNLWCFGDKLIEARKDEKVGAFNSEGIEVIPCKYDKIRKANTGLYWVEQKPFYFMIDSLGKKVCPKQVGKITSYSKSEFAKISVFNRENYINMENYINGNGDRLFSNCYKEMDRLLHGEYFIVKNSKNDKYGIIDITEKIIVPFKYQHLYYYSEDLIIVENEIGKRGVIDISNKEILPISFSRIDVKQDYIIASPWNRQSTKTIVLDRSKKTFLIADTFKHVSYKGENKFLIVDQEDNQYLYDFTPILKNGTSPYMNAQPLIAELINYCNFNDYNYDLYSKKGAELFEKVNSNFSNFLDQNNAYLSMALAKAFSIPTMFYQLKDPENADFLILEALTYFDASLSLKETARAYFLRAAFYQAIVNYRNHTFSPRYYSESESDFKKCINMDISYKPLYEKIVEFRNNIPPIPSGASSQLPENTILLHNLLWNHTEKVFKESGKYKSTK
jgi:WG containing repeat